MGLNNLNGSYSFEITKYSNHAKEIAAEASFKGTDAVIVLGGDGTLNEAANGLLQNTQNQTALSVIPLGTGNDFATSYRLTARVNDCIRRLIEPSSVWQDVIELQLADGSRHYCISMCGIGFDAYIARLANQKKKLGRRGKSVYLMAALNAVLRYKPVSLNITCNGNAIVGSVLSMALGIHQTNGGGLMQCPHAIANDGYISVTQIGALSFTDVLSIVPKLLRGKILTHKKVMAYQTTEIYITSSTDVPVETDGEDCGYLPIRAVLKPRRLKVLV